jgi:GTP cyclohydrolase I
LSVPTLSQIIVIADGLFPFEAAESWDNCGVQIGDPARGIHSIAFSLDPTPETVQFAAAHSCNLLVTHHPVLLEPIRTISSDTLPGRTLLLAAGLGVDILSLHTNLDAAPGGLNDELVAMLGLHDVVTPLPARCARKGRLPVSMSLRDLAAKVAKDLKTHHLRLVPSQETAVQTVFCVSGSGMGYLGDALRHGADVMITGDVRYHLAREAAASGMAVIDAGHYGLERIAIPLLARSFRERFREMGLDIPCLCCDLEEEPFIEIYNPQGGLSVERATATS